MSASERLLLGAAGLIGVAGVGLAAAGAHLEPGSSLPSAALIALVHAPAIVALLAARRVMLTSTRLGILAPALIVLGTALFCGDIAMRVFAKLPLFPMAAPLGGTVLILAWLTVAFAAAFVPKL